MPNPIFDIAPTAETVSINGTDHKVIGIPLRIVVQLVKDNPKLVGLLMGGALSTEELMSKGPDVVALIIACGFGAPDDENVRKKAADFPLDLQLDLIAGIIRATIGGGAGPFVKKLERLRKLIEMEDEESPPRVFRLKRAQPKTTPAESESSTPTSDSPTPKYGT